jgi:hypothetical protein
MSQPLAPPRFDPTDFRAFHFTGCSLASGQISLRYALDDAIHFEERIAVPVSADAVPDEATVAGLLRLLHLVAGVSYFKAAAPEQVICEGGLAPATRAFVEAMYSEGLGEFAAVNAIPLPRPRFPALTAEPLREPDPERTVGGDRAPRRVLVPVGGGKDSAVALEIVRRHGVEEALFAVGSAPAIERTIEVAGLPAFRATRQIDRGLLALNDAGALNGHVPITAVVACIALITAALNGFDTVALANERSASAPNTVRDGVEVNHQFSKSARAEMLLRAAVAEIAPDLQLFSILRGASELAIARAFARMPQYHAAFTSCNRIFQIDPALRRASWCGECDKCRFVFLILAPFMDPAVLEGIFARPMLDEEGQYDGFALLAGVGGHKPYECVGEVQESVAAMRLLAADPRWAGQRVVRRLVAEALPRFGPSDGGPAELLALSEAHAVPSGLANEVSALLGA